MFENEWVSWILGYKLQYWYCKNYDFVNKKCKKWEWR